MGRILTRQRWGISEFAWLESFAAKFAATNKSDDSLEIGFNFLMNVSQ
jgi:hypothetical protein